MKKGWNILSHRRSDKGKSLTQHVVDDGISSGAESWTFQTVVQWPCYSYHLEVFKLTRFCLESPINSATLGICGCGDGCPGVQCDTVWLWSSSQSLSPWVLLFKVSILHRISKALAVGTSPFMPWGSTLLQQRQESRVTAQHNKLSLQCPSNFNIEQNHSPRLQASFNNI